MKGRYAILTAVLFLCALVYLFPGTEGADAQVYPESYQQLDSAILIESDYMDADLPIAQGSGTAVFNIKSSASGNNYIGYFDGQLFLVLDAPAWISGNEATLPEFTLRYSDNEYVFSVASLSGADSVTVISLSLGAQYYLSTYPTFELYDGGVYLSAENPLLPRVWKSYCTLETDSWVIYDYDYTESIGTFVGSALINNHTVSVTAPSNLSMMNGIFGLDFKKGPLSVSKTEGGVTYTMEFQPLLSGSPVQDQAFTLGFVNNDDFPVQVGTSDTTGAYSLEVTCSGSGSPFTVPFDSVSGYKLNLFFDVTNSSEVYIGSASTKNVALFMTVGEHTPALVYGSGESPVYRYYPNTGGAGQYTVTTSPSNAESYQELRLLRGSMELRDGSNIRVGDAVVGAGEGSIIVNGGEENYVSVQSGGTFTIEGKVYTATATTDYDIYGHSLSSADLHGIMMQPSQTITLGNGALAYYDVQTTGDITRAVRNENSSAAAAKSLTVSYTDSSTPLIVRSDDTGLVIGSYLFDNNTLYSVDSCNITEAPFQATVAIDTGEFNVTSGQTGDVKILDEGGRFTLSNGVTYTAVTKSIFTGTNPNVVMESGSVNITGGDLSVTVRLPDNSTFTATGVSQATVGDTCSFTASADSTAVFGDIASYEIVSDSYFTLDSQSVLRMTSGWIIVPQGGQVTVTESTKEMTFAAPADSAGEIQYARNSYSIHSGVFTVSFPSNLYSSKISLTASGAGFTYDGSTFVYADGQADLDIYSGNVRLTGNNQSMYFDGHTLTGTGHFYSAGGQARISTGASSSAAPTLLEGSVNTEYAIIASGITFNPIRSATITPAGVVTVVGQGDGYDGIEASATITPPQGDPETQTLTYHCTADTRTMVLSFAVDTDLTATLDSGSVKLASGESITAAGHRLTAAANNTVLAIDNGNLTIESGSVSASSYTMNGLYFEGVNGETFNVYSTGKVGKSSAFHMYFDHDSTKQYNFSSNASFTVTDDGKPVISQNFVTLPQDGSFYFNTANGPCCVTAVTGSGMAVNGTNTSTITGIGQDEVVQVTGPGVSFYITGVNAYNDASVNVEYDGTLTISTGNSKEAIIELYDMTLYAGSNTFSGSGTLDVFSGMDAVTTTYTSGAFTVSGSLTFDAVSVEGEEYTVVSGTNYPLVTVPVSKSVTVTPSGGESTVFANASSTAGLELTCYSGVATPTDGEFYLNANTSFDLEAVCSVTLISDDDSDTAVVGVSSTGADYILL
ncbi:MAG: hypothetical protein J5707_02485, partial [Candidatus Methanomethylophilus sp.]|nr:hypothetical protein [Methanomethylophilus sp.]